MSEAKERVLARGAERLREIRAMSDEAFAELLAQELYLYCCVNFSQGHVDWDQLPDVGRNEGDAMEKARYRSAARWAMRLCGRTQERAE